MPSEILTLIGVAKRANNVGACYPSLGTIATDTSLSERTIRRSIKKLAAKRYLKITPGQSSNQYQLLLDGHVNLNGNDIPTPDKVSTGADKVSQSSGHADLWERPPCPDGAAKNVDLGGQDGLLNQIRNYSTN